MGLTELIAGAGNGGGTGNTYISTGPLATGPSGFLQLTTGNSASAASGNITLQTGTSGTTGTGNVSVISGAASSSGGSGSAYLKSGTTVNGNSGQVMITSGNTSGTGNAGEVTIFAGACTGSGTPGAVQITGGTGSATAVGGNLILNAGPDGGFGGGEVLIGAGTIPAILSPIPLSYIALSGPQTHVNAENSLLVIRLAEASLTAATASPTLITDYTWDDALTSGYSAVSIEYVMWEKVTGKVRRGTLHVVQNAVSGNEADFSYTDVTEVQNPSFPAVVLSVARVSTKLQVQFTNASANDVLIQSRVTMYPNNVAGL